VTAASSGRWWRLRAGLALVAVLLCSPAAAQSSVPDFATVRAEHRPTEGRLVDRAGRILSEVSVGAPGRRLEWVALDALAPAMKEVLLEAEDRRFYEHAGIDWRAFAAAVIQNLWYEHSRGASTLTMQLAGLLDPALHPGRDGGRRTLEQKWDQAVAAQQIEASWSKAEILEAYLNLAPFRGRLMGIHAASWALVGKTPGGLDRAEAAVLAALLRAPNAPPAKVAWRACELLGRIGSPERCERAQRLADRLDPVQLPPRWNDAPHLARALVHVPGEVVHTTLDQTWQRRLLTALAAAAPARAGAIVLDNASGAVLAHVGGLDAGADDATGQRFAAGTLAWPLMVALVLDTRRATAATLFADPVQGRPLSLRQWLSQGPPPAEALALMPAEQRALMIEVLRQGGAGAPSLPQARIDLPRLAALGRMLAVDGQWRAPYWRPEQESVPVPVLSPMAAFIANDLFPVVRVAEAVPGRSAWAVGSNAEVSIAVWMETGASARLETRTWLIAQLAGAGMWPPERIVPAGVFAAQVGFPPGGEAPRREWFITGTATAQAMPPLLAARIVAPADRAIIGPAELAGDGGLWLRASADLARLRWTVDGVPAGSGGQVRWQPAPGLHRVELRDERGRVVDAVEIAVRSAVTGARLQPAQDQPGQQ
jgi:penicillin-binding protein 1C